MKKFVNYLAVLIPFILVIGCEKDANISLPPYVPTLVIHSYIHPHDTGIVVFVNMSKPAYNSTWYDRKNVTNATVKISDGSNTYTLAFIPPIANGEFSCYYVDSTTLKVAPGVTYSLDVTTPDGKHATATTRIPEEVPLQSYHYEIRAGYYNDSVYTIKFSFNDPPGVDDYYHFGAYILNVDSINNQTNPSNSESYNTYFSADGKTINEETEVYLNSGFATTRWLDFRLMHVTREYYLYHESISNYDNSPFAEPNVPFTNINGGVGVFAGYNYHRTFIQIH